MYVTKTKHPSSSIHHPLLIMKRERDITTDNDDDDKKPLRPPPPPNNNSFHDHNQTPSSNSQIPSLTNNDSFSHVVKAEPSVDATASTGIDGGNNNKEQDRFLPIANVGRIMKKVSPGNGKISKDAKETVQECVSEFISFVTGEASDKCQREKRKTINGDDILWAIMTLGFEDYLTPLKLYLDKYREIDPGEKLSMRKQHQQQQQRVKQHIKCEQNINMPYSRVYPNPSLISQPPFVSTDPPFPLPFSSNPLETTTLPQPAGTIMPKQESIDDHW